MTNQTARDIAGHLSRIADALEAQAKPQRDRLAEGIAKVEELLGDPIPGVSPRQWARLVRRVNRLRRLL